MAMKVALFARGAVLPIYPRPGPKIAARTIPQNKKMRKIVGVARVKMKESTTGAQTKVPMLMGIFKPTLSATHPPELSPNTIPIMATENIRPSTDGTTPIDVR
jgi:hypothetical protein